MTKCNTVSKCTNDGNEVINFQTFWMFVCSTSNLIVKNIDLDDSSGSDVDNN